MADQRVIYLDNHATTPVDPRVLEAMLPYFTEKFGNAASRTHAYGWEAEDAVERGRQQVAKIIGAAPKDVIFTSGATESDNLAIKGPIDLADAKRNHIITTEVEHKAVLDPCKAIAKSGKARVTYVKVDEHGLVDPDEIGRLAGDDTALISVIHANNEIGTIEPIAEIGRIAARVGAAFHTDAAQSVGKLAIDVDRLGVDLLSISAHKLYGPKGVGALFVRSANRKLRLASQMHGGGHERGLRSGTLNVPGIVGLGEACELAGREMATESERVAYLRNRLQSGLMEALPSVRLNGHAEKRLAGNLNLSFAYIEGESLMMALKEIALSSGSACTSVTLEPSHVLRAIGLDEETAHASLRFGVGRFTSEAEIDYVIARVVKEVQRLRRLSPQFAAAQRG